MMNVAVNEYTQNVDLSQTFEYIGKYVRNKIFNQSLISDDANYLTTLDTIIPTVTTENNISDTIIASDVDVNREIPPATTTDSNISETIFASDIIKNNNARSRF